MQGGVHHGRGLGVVLAGPEGQVLLQSVVVALRDHVQRVCHQLTGRDITWHIPQLSLTVNGCCNADIMGRDDLQSAGVVTTGADAQSCSCTQEIQPV